MMYLERLEVLSVYYTVQELFTTVSGVKVVDDYPVDDLVIPSISVNAGLIRLENFELGNREGLRYRKWYIDIFAKNKAQRDEFGYRVLNAFDSGVTVYDYNAGFPPASGIPVIEHLNVMQKDMNFIRIMPELVDKMYYRATVSIAAVNDTV